MLSIPFNKSPCQQVNNGNSASASPVINHRSISLGSMGGNANNPVNNNGYSSSSSGSSREKTPSIVEIPPSPVIKNSDGFGFSAKYQPLNIMTDNGKYFPTYFYIQVILFEIDCAILYTNLHALFCQFISLTNWVNLWTFAEYHVKL